MNPKTILTEDGWDEAAPDCKGKDKDLRKALFFYWSLEDEDFDFRCKALGKIAALAGTLKAANEVKADRDAVKYLTDMITATKTKQGELTKAKAEAEKTKALAAKTEAMNQKKAHEAEEDEGDEDEDETGDSLGKLTKALSTLKTSKLPYYFLVCDAKPYGLVVSKKDIRKNMQYKKELATLAGGNTRPPKFGTCRRESNALIFEMEKPPAGLARILQKWIKSSTGLGLKVMVGSESADDEEEQPKTKQEERPVASEPPILAKAPEVWNKTRQTIGANIDKLKAEIRKDFAAEGPKMVAEIEQNMKKLDRVLDTLDDKLAASLAKANAAKDRAARDAELKNAKSLLAQHIKYVQGEAIIAHIDNNPFGVATNLRQVLTDTMTQMAQAIG